MIAASNTRRIGDVMPDTRGLFLFNHFAADSREVMLELCCRLDEPRHDRIRG